MSNPKTILAYITHPYFNQNHVYSFPACHWDEEYKIWIQLPYERKSKTEIGKYGFTVINFHCPILKRLNEQFKKRDSISKIDEEKIGGILL